MPVEFIGMIGTRQVSELDGLTVFVTGGSIDPAYVRKFGKVYEDMWKPIAAATGAYGNTTALVGTPEQVAESPLDYYEVGVTTLLIRGFDFLEDAIAYGRDVIPLVRAEIQRQEQHASVVA